MIGRIVEVADDRRHLFMHRGFMVVQDTEGERKELGQVPLDDIAAVIANAHGLSYTNNLLVALAERGAPFVLCGANHNAVGMLLPIEGNFEQAKRIEAQIAASLPTHKRLWAAVVRSKLEQQAAALEATGAPTAPLTALAAKVKSGDPENLEAQGARRYWGLLFGDGFRRDQDGAGLNGMLNYGYTVLRGWNSKETIDPWQVDWATITASNLPFRFQQAPGARNSLGRYKFNMPSSDAIYLHDTPNHNLFQKDTRALSSGCVRVNKASELANMLLQDAGWNDTRISDALKQGDTRYVNIRQNIPVNLYYLTAFVGPDGRTQYRTDIYNYDLTARSSAQIVSKAEQLIR